MSNNIGSSTTTTEVKNHPKSKSSGKFAEIFQAFQQKIDSRNDKWERLVKLSRDITIESKRIIFLLHRVTTCQENDDSKNAPNKIFQEAEDRFEILKQSKFYHLASELKNENAYQFSYPTKPGMQEFIEALSFYHFLKFDELLDIKRVRNFLNFEAKESNNDENLPQIIVSGEDYLGGIGDLSGELMRLAINYISAGDFEKPRRIVDFLRQLYNNFSSISRADVGGFYMGKEMTFKVRVMKQNLEKVENACYVLRLRGSEVPKHMLVDVLQCFFKQHESENPCNQENSW